jgi:hypothetical protein
MMKNSEFKIIIAVISLFITLAILLSAYNFYNKYLVEKPLTTQLTALPNVKSAKISKVDKEYLIQVQLKQVDNIQDSYNQIESTINGKIKNDKYKIEIQDAGSKKLSQFYNDLQPMLYQGLSGQQYLWLDEQIKERSSNKGIESRLYVDDKRVYLQMEDADSYLYKTFNIAETQTSGGGDS